MRCNLFLLYYLNLNSGMTAMNLIIWLQIPGSGCPAPCKLAVRSSLEGTIMINAWDGILQTTTIVMLSCITLIGMVPMRVALMTVSVSYNLQITPHDL